METIIMEDMIRDRASSYTSLFVPLSIFVTVCVTQFYALKWLGQKFPTLLPFGLILVITIQFRYPQYIYYPYIGSLYAARGEANKCLDLLRQETLKDPIKMNYSSTYGSCTAIFRLSHKAFVSRAAAQYEIDLMFNSKNYTLAGIVSGILDIRVIGFLHRHVFPLFSHFIG
ncbi:MAG: hypothetical protein BYD32DRAFT_489219 [Podila humilis]|nr:MAG: hypothetical protein BYD32DRAFT_489219 [Podila humilis]